MLFQLNLSKTNQHVKGKSCMYILFPNLALNKPVELYNVLLEPVYFDRPGFERIAVAGIAVQINTRQIESLSACLVWAAYRAGEEISCGKYIKAEISYVTHNTENPVNIESIAGFLPDFVKLPEIAIYWFARYLQSDSRRDRLMSLYSAMGSLPGGFDAVIKHFEAAGEKELGHELVREIAALRGGDEETGPAVYECAFDDTAIKRMENVFFVGAGIGSRSVSL